MTSEQRKRGAQPKPDHERQRHNATFRLRDDLRAALVEASQQSGVSVSEEVRWRLTVSFLFDHDIKALAARARLELRTLAKP